MQRHKNDWINKEQNDAEICRGGNADIKNISTAQHKHREDREKRATISDIVNKQLMPIGNLEIDKDNLRQIQGSGAQDKG